MPKKKQKQRNKKNKTPFKGFTQFIKEEKTQIVAGLLFLVMGTITILAFISYFFTWKTDQSFLWEENLSDPSIVVDNYSGKIGALLANKLISNAFGIGSFVIPFLLILAGLKLLQIKFLPFWKSLRIAIISAILLSVLLSLINQNNTNFLGYGPGGKHGLYMAKWLIAYTGNVGAFLIVILCIFSLIIFSWDQALHWLKYRLFNTFGSPVEKPVFNNTAQKAEEDEPAPDPSKNNNDLVFETEFATDNQESFSITQEKKNEKENDISFTVKPVVSDNDQITDNENTPELSIQKPTNEVQVGKNLEEKYDPKLELSNYKLPGFDLLEEYKNNSSSVTNEELIENKNKIIETLANYKIQIDKIKATIGPTVTLYEIVPAPGVRISKIKNLEDDIALSLSALGIRIIAPIPGKGTIGIEVPNQHPETVSMRSLISARKFQESKFELAVSMGKTVSNETYVFDLTKMPHLLIAGATGQGKSVGLNVILTSLLYKKHPSQLKLVMVDPKKVELTLFSKIEKHFLAKLPDEEEAIVTDTQKVIHTLQSLTIEMDQRYDLLKKASVRNIKEYNQKFIERQLNPLHGHKYLPYIVVVVDEFADLIMTAGKEVEAPLARLAQLARAIGIHLIIATQRPTTNIITGMIKANFPARIAFRVTSMMDSRTILDSPGANQLIGRGDMLIAPGSDMIRLQCGFVDIPELERITEHIQKQQSFPTAFMLPEVETEEGSEVGEVDLSKRDAMFDDAARLVVIHQQGSTSLIQRKFSIGYNRAGRIIDQLEAAGIVGPFEGSKARQVMFPDEYSLEQYLNQMKQS